MPGTGEDRAFVPLARGRHFHLACPRMPTTGHGEGREVGAGEVGRIGRDRWRQVNTQTDTAEILRALALILEPGQVTELRALDATTPTYRKAHTEFGFFDDPHKLAKAAAGIQAVGVYVVLNPIDPALLARCCNRVRPAEKGEGTSDTNILHRRWLPVDCDPVRLSGISSTGDEHAAALARARAIRDFLLGEGWGDPILADSGNGAHLLFRVDLPADDGGLIEKVLKALAGRFDDDAVKVDTGVFNPARIWKLYGTMAGKGDSIPDRPHRMARLIEVPTELHPVPLALLEAMAAEAPADPKAPTSPTAPRKPSQSGTGGRDFDLVAWMRQNAPEAEGPEPYQGGDKWIFDVCPWNPEHRNRSAFVIRRADGKIGAGCHHDHCQQYGWKDLRAMKEPGCYDRPAPSPAPSTPADDRETDSEACTAALTARDLLAQDLPMHTPVIDGLLRIAEIMNLIAAPKMGKSWLVLYLALCIASGRAFFERKVSRGKVLILDNELHLPTIASRLRFVADAMGLKPDDYADNLHIVSLRGRLADLYRLGARFQAIAPGTYAAIIIDAWYRTLPAGTDENDNGAMANLYNVLDQHAQRLQCAFILIHHSSKGGQADKSPTDVGSGAGSMARATDTHAILRQHEEDGVVVLEAVVRSFPPPDPVCLRRNFPLWEVDDTLDPADLKRPAPRRRAAKTKDDEAEESAREPWTPERFVGAFIGPKPLDKGTIIATANAAGMTKTMAGDLIRLAIQAGKAHVWKMPKTNAVHLADTPQPTLETVKGT